jgi:hypothetical protein
MKLVIVERSLPSTFTLADLAATSAAGKPCYEAHRVRLLRSLVSQDGRRVICEYEAPDAESVRQANRKVGLPFDAVWTADEHVAGQ